MISFLFRVTLKDEREKKEKKAIEKTLEIVAAIYDEEMAKEVELNKQEKEQQKAES